MKSTYVIQFKVYRIIFQHVNYTHNIKRKNLDEQRCSVLVRDEHCELKKQAGRERERKKERIFT